MRALAYAAPCNRSASWTLRALAQAERGHNPAVDTQAHAGGPHSGPCAASNPNLAQSGPDSPRSLARPRKKTEWRCREEGSLPLSSQPVTQGAHAKRLTTAEGLIWQRRRGGTGSPLTSVMCNPKL